MYHAQATGCTVVPADAEGKRMSGGWEFHYNGWSKPVPTEGMLGQAEEGNGCPDLYRNGATKENLFPDCRKGSLDTAILARLGLTEDRVLEVDGVRDSLFFYQLILPIHAINKEKNLEPIKGDPRLPFYSPKSKWTNVYAANEFGDGYGHKFVNTTPTELLQWDGVLVRDGVRGSSKGAILRRFDKRTDNSAYDKLIDAAFTKTRWLDLKRCVKLCDNGQVKKRGEEGYDPAYKYDYIFKVICHNVNAITAEASLDLCGDETTFGHQGYGEADSGLLVSVKGKPKITKGMQSVIISDYDRIRPRAYLHRHKKHQQHVPLPLPTAPADLPRNCI